jgi:hypothetical protein
VAGVWPLSLSENRKKKLLNSFGKILSKKMKQTHSFWKVSIYSRCTSTVDFLNTWNNLFLELGCSLE